MGHSAGMKRRIVNNSSKLKVQSSKVEKAKSNNGFYTKLLSPFSIDAILFPYDFPFSFEL